MAPGFYWLEEMSRCLQRHEWHLFWHRITGRTPRAFDPLFSFQLLFHFMTQCTGPAARADPAAVEFLGIWESVYNPAFNYGEFATIKSQAGLNSYKLSVRDWVGKTNAIGLRASAGRYGGTYAHKDIAFEFGMWMLRCSGKPPSSGAVPIQGWKATCATTPPSNNCSCWPISKA